LQQHLTGEFNHGQPRVVEIDIPPSQNGYGFLGAARSDFGGTVAGATAATAGGDWFEEAIQERTEGHRVESERERTGPGI
jgi:hypothetical protein